MTTFFGNHNFWEQCDPTPLIAHPCLRLFFSFTRNISDLHTEGWGVTERNYPWFVVTMLLFGLQRLCLNWTVVQDTGYTNPSMHAVRHVRHGRRHIHGLVVGYPHRIWKSRETPKTPAQMENKSGVKKEKTGETPFFLSSCPFHTALQTLKSPLSISTVPALRRSMRTNL